MTNVTAGMVAELREITGLGLMDCKKALVEANGDIKKAEEILRVKSGAKASKVAGRIAAEGMVAIHIDESNKSAAIVEVNCETDFVAKDDNLVNFANMIAKTIVIDKISSLEQLPNTMEDARKELIGKLGENITIRRMAFMNNTDGFIVSYLHGKKIGVLVSLVGGDLNLGKDIAMHIAASKPICVSANNVPEDKINSERNVYLQQAQASGKPQDIINKMVEGRVNKYLAEVTLLGQAFVKNPDTTIEKLLTENKATVKEFIMYTVGEGIEKKNVDFAAEVAAVAAER